VPVRVDKPITALAPNCARLWNFWLGGKDNFEIDRVVGRRVAEATPQVAAAVRAARVFLTRAVEYLAGPLGIRQFLDIGAGLPTADNTHEMAQRIAPESRIVYVDNDPVALAHARALLLSSPDGATAYLDADLRNTDEIMSRAGQTLDLREPVALVLMNVLGHIADFDEARAIVRKLVDGLVPGSYLVVADGTNEVDGPAYEAAIRIWNETGAPPYHLRTADQIATYFDGLDLVEPGVVSCPLWQPRIVLPDRVDQFCGVARKPASCPASLPAPGTAPIGGRCAARDTAPACSWAGRTTTRSIASSAIW